MSTASCIPVEDSIEIGMCLISILLCMALWGVATSQLVKYYELYPKDRWQLKVYVAAAWTCDTLAMAFMNYFIYVNTATTLSDRGFFFKPASYLGITMWNILFVPTSLFTQIFNLYRIWMFGRESTTLNHALLYCVVSFIVLCMTSATSMALYLFVVQIQDPTTAPNIEVLLYTSFMSSVIMTDLLLTLSLVYLLLRHQTGALKGTKHIISRLVTYSLTTGALSLTLAIIAMTFQIVSPSGGYNDLFSLPLVPVYLILLLASLNVRRSLRDSGQINGTTLTLPAMSSGGAMDTGGVSHAHNPGIPSGSIHFASNPEIMKSTYIVGSSGEQV